MYPYHNRIIQRIRNGECTGVLPSDKEEFAFILTFSTPPFTRPIRPHAVWRYWNLPELNLEIAPKSEKNRRNFS